MSKFSVADDSHSAPIPFSRSCSHRESLTASPAPFTTEGRGDESTAAPDGELASFMLARENIETLEQIAALAESIELVIDWQLSNAETVQRAPAARGVALSISIISQAMVDRLDASQRTWPGRDCEGVDRLWRILGMADAIAMLLDCDKLTTASGAINFSVRMMAETIREIADTILDNARCEEASETASEENEVASVPVLDAITRHRSALRARDDLANVEGGEAKSGEPQGVHAATEALAAAEAELLAAVLAHPPLKITAEAQAALLYSATENGGGEALYEALAKAIVASIANERERKALELFARAA
jgi:hypothetical protein